MRELTENDVRKVSGGCIVETYVDEEGNYVVVAKKDCAGGGSFGNGVPGSIGGGPSIDPGSVAPIGVGSTMLDAIADYMDNADGDDDGMVDGTELIPDQFNETSTIGGDEQIDVDLGNGWSLDFDSNVGLQDGNLVLTEPSATFTLEF